MSLSLHDLAASDHPTMVDGNFSIFNDPRVSVVSSQSGITADYDTDGVVLTSR